jgi:hypothetical protein
MGILFDPERLHEIAKKGVGLPQAEMFRVVAQELAAAYPGHIRTEPDWIFNNAGGAMGQIALLHASLSEYVLFFGTPIGTEGHSGRYATEVYDFVMAGEMWCYHEGETARSVYQPGDAAYLGRSAIKGYRIPDFSWMLEYARGPIPTMLPFGLADTVTSTLDARTVGRTLWSYGRMVTGELLRGKV